MIVIVYGSRYQDDQHMIEHEINKVIRTLCTSYLEVHKIFAADVDKLASAIATELGLDHIAYHASWKMYRTAGPLRNHRVLTEVDPDLVLAFPGEL